MTGIDIDKILQLAPSPAYVVDLGRLRHNLAILDDVQKRSGAKILLALKAFSMWSVFPLIRQTLQGVCASSPWEARLGREEFGREVHSFAAAFKASDVVELLGISIWFSTPSISLSAFALCGRRNWGASPSVCESTRNTPRGIPISTIPAPPIRAWEYRIRSSPFDSAQGKPFNKNLIIPWGGLKGGP